MAVGDGEATRRKLTVALGIVANEEGRIEVRKVEDLDRQLLERREAHVGRVAVELVGLVVQQKILVVGRQPALVSVRRLPCEPQHRTKA